MGEGLDFRHSVSGLAKESAASEGFTKSEDREMATVYLVCGVSGSGKSWVCRQLSDKFNYIPHDRCWSHPTAKPDEGLDPKWGPKDCKSTHVETIAKEAKDSDKPILTEVPFGERLIKEQLEAKGLKVRTVFVIEDPGVISERYQKREGKPLQKAAVTRATSIKERAKEWGSFFGTSDEVLNHLKDLKVIERMTPQEWRRFNLA